MGNMQSIDSINEDGEPEQATEKAESESQCRHNKDFIPQRQYCKNYNFGDQVQDLHLGINSGERGGDSSNNGTDSWNSDQNKNNTNTNDADCERQGRFDPDWEIGHCGLKFSPSKTNYYFNPSTNTLRGYEHYNPFRPPFYQQRGVLHPCSNYKGRYPHSEGGCPNSYHNNRSQTVPPPMSVHVYSSPSKNGHRPISSITPYIELLGDSTQQCHQPEIDNNESVEMLYTSGQPSYGSVSTSPFPIPAEIRIRTNDHEILVNTTENSDAVTAIDRSQFPDYSNIATVAPSFVQYPNNSVPIIDQERPIEQAYVTEYCQTEYPMGKNYGLHCKHQCSFASTSTDDDGGSFHGEEILSQRVEVGEWAENPGYETLPILPQQHEDRGVQASRVIFKPGVSLKTFTLNKYDGTNVSAVEELQMTKTIAMQTQSLTPTPVPEGTQENMVDEQQGLIASNDLGQSSTHATENATDILKKQMGELEPSWDAQCMIKSDEPSEQPSVILNFLETYCRPYLDLSSISISNQLGSTFSSLFEPPDDLYNEASINPDSVKNTGNSSEFESIHSEGNEFFPAKSTDIPTQPAGKADCATEMENCQVVGIPCTIKKQPHATQIVQTEKNYYNSGPAKLPDELSMAILNALDSSVQLRMHEIVPRKIIFEAFETALPNTTNLMSPKHLLSPLNTPMGGSHHELDENIVCVNIPPHSGLHTNQKLLLRSRSSKNKCINTEEINLTTPSRAYPVQTGGNNNEEPSSSGDTDLLNHESISATKNKPCECSNMDGNGNSEREEASTLAVIMHALVCPETWSWTAWYRLLRDHWQPGTTWFALFSGMTIIFFIFQSCRSSLLKRQPSLTPWAIMPRR